MNLLSYIIIFSLVGGVLSLMGAIIIVRQNLWSANCLVHFISFATGTLMGTAFLELLPEAIQRGTTPNKALAWTLGGFVVFFILEGLMHWSNKKHDHKTDIPVGGHHDLSHAPWMITISDSIHNLVDGVAIAAAFLISIPLGLLTTFAIATHEIPQEIGDMAIMLHAGWNSKKVFFWNIISSLTAVIGAVGTYFLRDTIEPIIGLLLALTAGFFIYIGASDLVPELYNPTRRDKLNHVVPLFLFGILIIGLLTRFE